MDTTMYDLLIATMQFICLIQSEAQICRLQTWCGTFIKDEVTTLANREANADLDPRSIYFIREHSEVSADKLYAPWIQGFGLQGGVWVGLSAEC